MFIAASGRCGTERGVPWVGGSVIVDCDGYPLAGPLSAEDAFTIYATLDLAQADVKWISTRNHVLNDRRPELYGLGNLP
jgi:predicted amidohydrolase